MKFVQIVIAEEDSTPSGAVIRNQSNFDMLSTFYGKKDAGRVFAIRPSQTHGEPSRSSIVTPLNAGDILAMINACRQNQPDVALIEGVQLLQAAHALSKACPDVFIITDMHNIESDLYCAMRRQRVPKALHKLAPWYGRWKYSENLEAERQIVDLSSQIWVCSVEDKDRAQQIFAPKPIATISNPVPEWALRTAPSPASSHNDLLFVGHLGYSPNRQAVKFLCNEVMPIVRARLSRVNLHVCGRAPRTKTVQLLEAGGHRLTANAHDLTDVYADAAAVVVPLFQGGGTRLKILEAMAVRRPIIATAKAVEGLALVPGKHYLRAESATEFAEAIDQVFKGGHVVEQMIDAAHQTVVKDFGSGARQRAITQAMAGIS